MTKVPKIKHEYHAKKDKLEITIQGYELKGKASRASIIKKVIEEVERKPDRLIVNAKKTAKKGRTKNLRGAQKDNKLIEVGD